MSRRSLYLLLPLLALLFTGFVELPEQASTILVLPYIIRKPGVYVLRHDLAYKLATGAAITIEANDVILDLGGRTFTSTPPVGATNSAIGIASSGFGNLAIRHGTLVGFFRAIEVGQNSGIGRTLIQDVVCDHSLVIGIHVASGVDTAEIRDCRVRNTGTASSTGNVWGILSEASHNVVAGNEVFETLGIGGVARGIQVGSGSSLVQSNLVSNQTLVSSNFGVIIFGTTGNFAIGNCIAGFGTGITFANVPGKYRDNLTSNCTTAFSGGTAVGTSNN